MATASSHLVGTELHTAHLLVHPHGASPAVTPLVGDDGGVRPLTKGIELERTVEATVDPRRRVAGLIRLALWYADVERGRAQETAEKALAAAHELGEPVLLRRSQYARAVVGIFVRARPHDTADYYHELLRLGVEFESAGLPRDAAWCDLISGIALANMGDSGGTVLLVDRALAAFRRLDDLGGQARCLNTLGAQQALSGRLHEALELFQRSSELAAKGDLFATHALAWLNFVEAWINIGRGARSDGRMEEAKAAFDIAYEQCGPLRRQLNILGHRQLQPRLAGLCAIALAQLGREALAEREAERALSLAEADGSPEVQCDIHSYVAEAWLALGRYEGARDLFGQAWASKDWLCPTDTARVLRGMVAAHEALGDLSSALAFHRQLLDVELVLRDQVARREREIVRARLGVATDWATGEGNEKVLAEELARENQALVAERQQLERLAYTDAVTGLANRRLFDSQLTRMSVRAELARRPLSLILVDIDHFKRINDGFSHLAGDEVLRRVAAALKQACRRGDFAARVGGEEFALLLPGVELSAAIVAGERLCQAVRECDVADVCPGMGVTVSAGVASFCPGVSPELVYAAADDALYRAKETGRNKVCVAPLSAMG